MAVRKTDSEFGGRGGPLPPAEFVPAREDLEPWQQAALERKTDGPGRGPGAPETEDEARAQLEKRARLNDTLGR